MVCVCSRGSALFQIRDCCLFPIENATELSLKGGPGTVRDVSTDQWRFPVNIVLRYFY